MTRMVYGYDSTPGALTWLAATYRKARRLATIGTLENGVEALAQLAPRIWPQPLRPASGRFTAIFRRYVNQACRLSPRRVSAIR